MKTVATLLIIAVILAFNIQAISQKNKASRGYFVTTENDTVFCEFTTRKWKRPPKQVVVMVGARDSILRPEEVKSFFVPVNNLHFYSYKIELVKFNSELQRIIPYKEPEFDASKFVFLELVYTGKLKLYSYLDVLDQEHFFILGKNGLQEIYKHLYMDSVIPLKRADRYNRETRMIYNNQYSYVLKVAMGDCVEMFRIIDDMEFTRKTLKDVLKKYDQCE